MTQKHRPGNDDKHVPTHDHGDDSDVYKRDVPLTEADQPIMKAPEDWPPPPDEEEK